MSNVKVYSFTAHPDTGWVVVTPIGLVKAEPGMQVTIAVSETWEAAADAMRALREKPPEENE